MFAVTCKVTTCLEFKLPPGEMLQSSDEDIVVVKVAGQKNWVKAMKIGEASVALYRNGVNVDSAAVIVVA